MNPFVSIISANLASELHLLRSRLEFEGVECYIKDELSNQVNPIYSVAAGGVELMVRKDQYTDALQILLECGYELPKENTRVESFFTKFDEKTSRLPLFNKLGVHSRLLALSATFVILMFVAFYYISRPDLYETLTETRWAVQYIDHNGQVYKPKTIGSFIHIAGKSIETLDFWPNTRVYLPGINTSGEFGTWFLNGDRLAISGVQDLSEVYNGIYEVSISFRGELTLKNEQTVIRCYQQ